MPPSKAKLHETEDELTAYFSGLEISDESSDSPPTTLDGRRTKHTGDGSSTLPAPQARTKKAASATSPGTKPSKNDSQQCIGRYMSGLRPGERCEARVPMLPLAVSHPDLNEDLATYCARHMPSQMSVKTQFLSREGKLIHFSGNMIFWYISLP